MSGPGEWRTYSTGVNGRRSSIWSHLHWQCFHRYHCHILLLQETAGPVCEQYFFWSLEKYLSQLFLILDLILQDLSTFIDARWKSLWTYKQGCQHKSKIWSLSRRIQRYSTLYLRGGGRGVSPRSPNVVSLLLPSILLQCPSILLQYPSIPTMLSFPLSGGLLLWIHHYAA